MEDKNHPWCRAPIFLSVAQWYAFLVWSTSCLLEIIFHFLFWECFGETRQHILSKRSVGKAFWCYRCKVQMCFFRWGFTFVTHCEHILQELIKYSPVGTLCRITLWNSLSTFATACFLSWHLCTKQFSCSWTVKSRKHSKTSKGCIDPLLLN